jgi:transglutaminase 1
VTFVRITTFKFDLVCTFSVAVTVGNKNRSKDYTVVVTLRVDSVLYTGQMKGKVKQEKFERVIKAGTAQNVAMPVTYQEYAQELSDQGAYRISCLASVKETEFEFFSNDDFRVRKPDIVVKVGDSIFPLDHQFGCFETFLFRRLQRKFCWANSLM